MIFRRDHQCPFLNGVDDDGSRGRGPRRPHPLGGSGEVLVSATTGGWDRYLVPTDMSTCIGVAYRRTGATKTDKDEA